jgi:hypothetical protein
MKTGLLPCSICGGKGMVKSMDPLHRRNYRFKCSQCGLTIDRSFVTREEAYEAWNSLHSPKLREIANFEIPDGYTLVPADLFKEAVDLIRSINTDLFRRLTPYNIWHYNVPKVPPKSDPVVPIIP